MVEFPTFGASFPKCLAVLFSTSWAVVTSMATTTMFALVGGDGVVGGPEEQLLLFSEGLLGWCWCLGC